LSSIGEEHSALYSKAKELVGIILISKKKLMLLVSDWRDFKILYSRELTVL